MRPSRLDDNAIDDAMAYGARRVVGFWVTRTLGAKLEVQSACREEGSQCILQVWGLCRAYLSECRAETLIRGWLGICVSNLSWHGYEL